MSLNRNEKQAVVTDVAAQAARAQTLALAEYRGLTVEHLNALRKQARDKGVYLHVLKNTLARRAVAGTPFEVAQATMVGPLIYGFSEDAVAAAIRARSASVVAGTMRSTMVAGKAMCSATYLPRSGFRRVASRVTTFATVRPLAGRLSQHRTVKGGRPRALRARIASTRKPGAERGVSGWLRSWRMSGC